MIAILEGIAFLVLLVIAMPLKYMADIPQAVSVVGALHGVLFVMYAIWLAVVKFKYDWSINKAGIAFIASFIPFGTFILDRKLKQEATNA
jgi:integral membrane protein